MVPSMRTHAATGDSDVATPQRGSSIAPRVERLMPELKSDLMRLVRIPSIAFPGYPTAPVGEAHDLIAELLGDAGVEHVETLSLPDTSPIITAQIPAPNGAPTVLLYAHYDVQPPGDEGLWKTPPFEPTVRDGAIYGRGAADDKSNLIAHIGALRAFDGKPPVGIKILFEGQEEYGSALDDYPLQHPEPFRADAIVVGDVGNVRAGTPTLTIALRGDAADALIVLLHALASLHDEHGDVAVAGLRREAWTGASYTEDEFRQLAGVEPGVPLFGTGSLGERLWSGPAITVMGLDAPAVETAAAAVVPYARAKLNLRVHPQQSATEARDALIRDLEAVRPFGVAVRAAPSGGPGDGFSAVTTGPAYAAARAALRTAWGSEPVDMAIGGAIPLASAMHQAVPDAEILLFGAQDGHCNLHAPNERVLLDELERTVLAEAQFFSEYATRKERSR